LKAPSSSSRTSREATPIPEIDIAIRVEAGDWGDRRKLGRLAKKAVAASMASGLRATPGSELSILFTDDASIRVLNATWRKIDKPTNVLSFPGTPPKGAVYGPLLGDIVLAHETVLREAQEQHLTFDHHLTHLIVHGLLHLFGHDHIDEGEAEMMESLETAILGSLGIGDPYAARDSGPADG
jgi:probable rRNA maturation factor